MTHSLNTLNAIVRLTFSLKREVITIKEAKARLNNLPLAGFTLNEITNEINENNKALEMEALEVR